MDALFLFVLKSICVSGILCAWYMLVLRNRRLHNYNRVFLLLILYAGIQVPLLDFRWSPFHENPVGFFTSTNFLVHSLDAADAPQPSLLIPTADLDWQAISVGIAALISLSLLVPMFLQIVRIIRVRRKFPQLEIDGVVLVRTDLPDAPFSFMNLIFWRDDIPLDSESGRMILRHELAHVKQKHSYDKLACQLLTCIFWMNPFYWIIRKELSMVHEFIADEHGIGSSTEADSAEAFARMLLQVHSPSVFLSPGQHFFSSPIKRRLIMLRKNKSVRASLLRRAAVLPLIAGCLLIFSFHPRVAPGQGSAPSDRKIVLVVDAGHGGTDGGCRSGSLVEKELTLKVAKRMKELAQNFNIEAHLTRSKDEQVSLQERVAFSNGLHPDGFISIHIDDQPAKEAQNGTFDIAINAKGEKAEDSKRLANAIYQRSLRPEWATKNTISEKNIFVLRDNNAAAVLIEVGNIKSKAQMQHLEDDAKLDELCSRILEGVVEAYKK